MKRRKQNKFETLIGLRLDRETTRQIDAMVERSRHLNRSDIIRFLIDHALRTNVDVLAEAGVRAS